MRLLRRILGLGAACGMVASVVALAPSSGGSAAVVAIHGAVVSGGGLHNPSGVAVAGNGDYFVADSGNNRIVHYDAKGTFLGSIGQPAGAGLPLARGDLAVPTGVALDGKGNLFVADLGHGRVAEYNLSGAYIGQLGSYGFAAGQLLGPTAVAVGSNGTVYVLDTGGDKVNRFTAQGKFVSRWGGFGSGIAEFDGPSGLALDRKGNVYIGDTNNNRVQEFSPEGNYLAQWGQFGKGEGDFRYPTGVAVDASDNIWVADAGNSRVVTIENPATFRGAFALSDAGGAGGIAVAGQAVYVVDAAGEKVLAYTTSGATTTTIGQGGRGQGQLSKPTGVAVDKQGNIYVADTNNNRIQKFSPSGTVLAAYGKQGKAPEAGSPRFLGPSAVAVDSSGNIYVADTFNSRIEKLDASGSFVWQASTGGQTRGVAVDASGNVYATSFFNQHVLKFDAAGKLVTSWGGRGRTNGLFMGPSAIALDKSGRIYVADAGNSRVAIFSLSPDGTYAYSGQVGGAGTGQGQFSSLAGIAVAGDDTVYAVDAGGHRVQKFNPFGAQFKSWGSTGQLQSLVGMTLDARGHVIVADRLSNRVGIYSAGGDLIRQFP